MNSLKMLCVFYAVLVTLIAHATEENWPWAPTSASCAASFDRNRYELNPTGSIVSGLTILDRVTDKPGRRGELRWGVASKRPAFQSGGAIWHFGSTFLVISTMGSVEMFDWIDGYKFNGGKKIFDPYDYLDGYSFKVDKTGAEVFHNGTGTVGVAGKAFTKVASVAEALSALRDRYYPTSDQKQALHEALRLAHQPYLDATEALRRPGSGFKRVALFIHEDHNYATLKKGVPVFYEGRTFTGPVGYSHKNLGTYFVLELWMDGKGHGHVLAMAEQVLKGRNERLAGIRMLTIERRTSDLDGLQDYEAFTGTDFGIVQTLAFDPPPPPG